ncbi:hypothetical protein JXA32_10475 [Candidatus Sumerlaeota bacterium]|nr:hypothetical protein [Candidatus Sumerlaeota bacterium]
MVKVISDYAEKRLLIGTGKYLFNCEHDWLCIPPDIMVGNTHAIDQDSQGRLYIFHTVHPASPCRNAVIVTDAEGIYLDSWGEEFAGGAHGLMVHRDAAGDEWAFLSDIHRGVVVKATLSGETQLVITAPMASGIYASHEQFRPTATAVGPDERIYVADGYGRSYIHIFSPDGEWLDCFGGEGEVEGCLSCPHAIRVDDHDNQPRLLVVDRGNARIQSFSLEGESLGCIHGDLRKPSDVISYRGGLLVADLEAKLTVIDAKDRMAVHLGDGGSFNSLRELPRDRFLEGQFIAPHCVMKDAAERILVAEWVPLGRLTRLTPI